VAGRGSWDGLGYIGLLGPWDRSLRIARLWPIDSDRAEKGQSFAVGYVVTLMQLGSRGYVMWESLKPGLSEIGILGFAVHDASSSFRFCGLFNVSCHDKPTANSVGDAPIVCMRRKSR
jgi:hypothetical protein